MTGRMIMTAMLSTQSRNTGWIGKSVRQTRVIVTMEQAKKTYERETHKYQKQL